MLRIPSTGTDELPSDCRDELAARGFFAAPNFLTIDEVAELRTALAVLTEGRRGYGNRNLLRNCALVRTAASSRKTGDMLRSFLGTAPFATRAILFDKLPGANWGVGWHQDLTVAVAERIEAPGFGAWTVKKSVPHPQPPVHTLENILILRIHLDNAGGENGALIVVPGSHRHGRLPESVIAGKVSETAAMVCVAGPGDVLAFRPLLLHMSRRSARPSHRRVIQIEYSAVDLPPPLAWREPRIGS